MDISLVDIQNIPPQYDTPTLNEKNGSMNESNEEFIDRMFKHVSSETISCRKKSHVNSCIDTPINKYSKVQDSREGFYELELINLYKERIKFLEGEMKNKDKMIDKLMINISQLTNTIMQQNTSKSEEILSTDSSKKLILVKDKQNSLKENLTKDDSISTKENNKDTNDLDSQLKKVREEHHEKFIQHNNSNDSHDNVAEKKKLLLIGDSMLNGINEKALTNDKIKVNMKYFSGAKINDIYSRLDELLEEKPNIVVIHVGTNNAPHMASNKVIDELLKMKHRVERTLPSTKVVISSLITRSDDGKANLTIKKVNRHLNQLKINVMDNENITHQDLGKKGLHLSKFGKVKFERNLINKMSEFS